MAFATSHNGVSGNVNDLLDTSPQNAVNINEIRARFPGLPEGTALFNNAAGTVVLKDAIESASKLMQSMPMPGGSDTKSMEAIHAYQKNKTTVAGFLNAGTDEITFGQSTTCLFRLLGISLKPLLSSDCEIVCSTLCHEAMASAWIRLARDLGATIKWWSPNQDDPDDPRLSLERLQQLLTPKTRIVTCNHVSNVIGSIHPIRAVARLVHQTPGCMLMVDGVACVPHRAVDVKALEVDFYCFSWYKVFGPHLATLYASRRAQDRYMTSLNHFFVPSGSLDGKLALGMPSFEMQSMCGPIVRYLQDFVGWETIVRQETLLTRIVLDHLLSKPAVYRVFGRRVSDPTQRVSIITFEVRGQQSGDVVSRINARNRVRIVAGECLAPRPTRDVLKPESSDGLIRVSIVHYNTVQEAETLCDELDLVLAEMQSEVRSPSWAAEKSK
ncbi:NRPS-like enzyme, putative [Cordyceps militaris CM01]|uniref:NRPS-like enzyme, putative n=1 Tax=Cordyceps militaris (strain CM01) TaxID=983644 RepID=G3JCC1_CORMM|nr:NRPS-like enzyme, putative [Cordyceps militaris CM01]EGX93786.1 NRPS-like enzyme, putative [Cordyceps militaris CM01]